MRLSTKGRYAVMAMVDLAMHSDGKPIALAAIADRQEISLSYLEQLHNWLKAWGKIEDYKGIPPLSAWGWNKQPFSAFGKKGEW